MWRICDHVCGREELNARAIEPRRCRCDDGDWRLSCVHRIATTSDIEQRRRLAVTSLMMTREEQCLPNSLPRLRPIEKRTSAIPASSPATAARAHLAYNRLTPRAREPFKPASSPKRTRFPPRRTSPPIGQGWDHARTDPTSERGMVSRSSDPCWRPDFLRHRVGMHLTSTLTRPHAEPARRRPARGNGPSCPCLPIAHDHGADRQRSIHVGDRDEPGALEGRGEHRGVLVHRDDELIAVRDERGS